MLSSLIIRPIKQSDYNQWLPLWDGYNAFYGRAGETALASEITQTTHYIYHRSTTALTTNWYLQDLFTAEHLRGKGIARALINAVYEVAQLEHSSRVYWFTHETNATAMLLYDKVAERTGIVVYRKMF
jgi:GNAT superfamily N-acetyltransferase